MDVGERPFSLARLCRPWRRSPARGAIRAVLPSMRDDVTAGKAGEYTHKRLVFLFLGLTCVCPSSSTIFDGRVFGFDAEHLSLFHSDTVVAIAAVAEYSSDKASAEAHGDRRSLPPSQGKGQRSHKSGQRSSAAVCWDGRPFGAAPPASGLASGSVSSGFFAGDAHTSKILLPHRNADLELLRPGTGDGRYPCGLGRLSPKSMRLCRDIVFQKTGSDACRPFADGKCCMSRAVNSTITGPTARHAWRGPAKNQRGESSHPEIIRSRLSIMVAIGRRPRQAHGVQ